MDFGGPIFILAIITVCTAGWLINNWIRAKHGYALEDEWGGKTERLDSGETKRLREENAMLHDKLDTMQDRMVVLEKIVTDRGYSLSEEIEALRIDDRKALASNGRERGRGVMEKLALIEALAPMLAIITLIGTGGWVLNTWLRIKNGYPLESSWGKAIYPQDRVSEERIKLVTQENAKLQAELGSMKDRLANVERIVTDSGYQLTHEIDRLRGEKDVN